LLNVKELSRKRYGICQLVLIGQFLNFKNSHCNRAFAIYRINNLQGDFNMISLLKKLFGSKPAEQTAEVPYKVEVAPVVEAAPAVEAVAVVEAPKAEPQKKAAPVKKAAPKKQQFAKKPATAKKPPAPKKPKSQA
jgi:hypothetical protein